MTAPKIGDEVKVEYKAKVLGTTVTYTGDLLRLRREDGKTIAVNAKYATVIEPEYETATVYLDANNIFYLRGHGFWIFCADGTERGHNFPKRPLRKLVPEA
jgi:hypothetical protein